MADLSEARLAGLPSARTIHFRIASLVLLILAPLLAAFCWMAFHLAASKRELIEAERAAITAAVTSDIDRHVSTTFGLLTGLATSDDLVTGNFAEFERQARAMADRADIVRVWAFDPGGQTVAGMGKPANAESAEGLEPETITRTFRGERTVSRVHGSGPEEATVFMAVPVRGGSTVLYGIAAEVLIGGMGRTFTKAGMPDPWVAAIVDGNGRFIARSLDADRRLGKIARPELVRVAAAPSEKGVFENVTYEGLHTLNSYRRSPLTGWTTVVAVPKAIVEAPLHRSIYLMLIGGAIALLSTLGAAYLYATRISEPVLNLGRIASALAKGAPYVPTRHPLVELEEVQRAFEAAIAESAHLAALVNSSGDAIMSMDLDGRIRTWNPAAEQLFGYTAEEIIGRPKATLVPPEALDEHLSIQAEVASGNNRRTETVRQNRNGMRISVSLDAAPIRRPDGMIIGISSILHDITERIADEEHRHFLMRE
ncbi:MAG: PAS domain S-box protein, partial [Hyphomicrobiaceae bacterium]